MAIKKLGKAAAALALVVGLTASMAGSASADPIVEWNGVRGLDSIGPCGPDEAAEFHWIFTPGGGNTVSSATLTFEGEEYVGTQSGNGAWHFFSHGSEDPGDAFVTYGGTKGRNALLTISHGCFGEEPPPES